MPNYADMMVTATGGARSRRLGDRLADMLNPKDFGAVVGGVVDAKAAIDAMAANDNGAIYLAPGVWKYGTNDFGTPAGVRFYGPGVAKFGNNKTARNFAYLSAPPAEGETGSVFTAFNGDHSKCLLPLGYRVGGATTVGNPASGYVQRPETAAIHGHAHFGSDAGKNQATDWTDGRTGWAFMQVQVDHYGQGDANGLTIGVNIFNNKAGATHFLAQPAGNVMNGGVTAFADHVNAVIGEFYVKGQTYDINGTGFALHFERNIGTGAQEAMWRGISIISSGSQPMDSAFVARGKIKRGFEIANADLGADQAAIAMSADQRIYGSVTYQNTSSANALASGYKVFQALGSAYFSYASSISQWAFNNPITAYGQISSSLAAGNNRGLNLQTNNANRFRVLIDGTAESGSNAGSNFKISRHSDAGAELDQPIYIVRDTGAMRLGVAGASMGFFGAAGVGKPSITGSRGGNAALADLLTDLAALGLITDSTTA